MPHAFREGPVPVNEDDALIAERSALYETLKTLTPEEWDHASLCAGWRNRDVAAHVEAVATIKIPRLLLGMAINRGDCDRFMVGHARRLGDRPASAILESWKDAVSSTRTLPTTRKVEVALDTFVHHHDICVPIGRDVPTDPERLRWMADGIVATTKAGSPGDRLKGLRLIATDIDWHYGTGAEIRGPVVALLLLGAGRSALVDQLEGDGLAELERRP